MLELDRSRVRRDGGTQPRAELNEDHIQDLADDVVSGADLDPVLVYYDGTDYWLVDGFHRDKALLEADVATIKADVRSGSLLDAQWHSYSVNKQHRVLKRNQFDKRRAVIGALKHPYGINKNNVELATHCGVAESYVRLIRSQLEDNGEIVKERDRTVTRGGTTYTQRTRTATLPIPPQKVERQVLRVNAPELPYHGQTVEVLESKGDFIKCRTASGDIHPFLRTELSDPNTIVTITVPSTVVATQPSDREKLIQLAARMPDELVKDAIALLEELMENPFQ